MVANSSRSAAVALTRRAVQQCTKSSAPTSSLACGSRAFSTTPKRLEAETQQGKPRWSYTPEAMKAPFSPHITKDPSRKVWRVNSDPAKLDAMYQRLLGNNADKLLPEEIKWLAVTHKSFDQGRRGFNDKLAFMGRQAVLLEATQFILATPLGHSNTVKATPGRKPFRHESLDKVDRITQRHPGDLVTTAGIERLARSVGLDQVLRWKPRKPENMVSSGQQMVLNGAIHAIIGAISLQHGAEVAGKLIRERILSKLQ